MNTTATEAIVTLALKKGYGLWVDTDMGELDLYGADLEETYDNLGPGEGFAVLGILTKEES
jgi:hypothetical protein